MILKNLSRKSTRWRLQSHSYHMCSKHHSNSPHLRNYIAPDRIYLAFFAYWGQRRALEVSEKSETQRPRTLFTQVHESKSKLELLNLLAKKFGRDSSWTFLKFRSRNYGSNLNGEHPQPNSAPTTTFRPKIPIDFSIQHLVTPTASLRQKTKSRRAKKKDEEIILGHV